MKKVKMGLSLMAIVFEVAFGMLKQGEKISGVIGNFLLGGISLENRPNF